MNFDYTKALYRRNNQGKPCVWFGEVGREYGTIIVHHGILGGAISTEVLKTNRVPADDVESRFKAKRKTGYKLLSEVKDNDQLPVEEALLTYLDSYLPHDRTTESGDLLPMLAKAYDNENDKLFKKIDYYIAQPKLNGLRCTVRFTTDGGDIFTPIRAVFQSREGTIWNTLQHLEAVILKRFELDDLKFMVEANIVLDGEVYLPGFEVNFINHFVKDPKSEHNAKLQFWCYDLAVEEVVQENRLQWIASRIGGRKLINEHCEWIDTKEHHLGNTKRFVIVDCYYIRSHEEAVKLRDDVISWGFEGIVLRQPQAEYQFGKRNSAMIKFKKFTDGTFKIVDIYPEPKRVGVPILKLRNDINNETFETHLSGSHKYQKSVLDNKQNYIGLNANIEYAERSGQKAVPFHIKNVEILL